MQRDCVSGCIVRISPGDQILYYHAIEPSSLSMVVSGMVMGVICSKTPQTRTSFWESKIAKTVERDRRTMEILIHEGWRVLIVWECALRGSRKIPIDRLLEECEAFIQRSAIARAELAATSAETGKSSSDPPKSDRAGRCRCT